MDNKSMTVLWRDDFFLESYAVVLQEYGLQLLAAKKTTDDGEPAAEIVVYGPNEAADAFYEDYLEDSFPILESLSLESDDDDLYASSLKLASEIVLGSRCWPRL